MFLRIAVLLKLLLNVSVAFSITVRFLMLLSKAGITRALMCATSVCQKRFANAVCGTAILFFVHTQTSQCHSVASGEKL